MVKIESGRDRLRYLCLFTNEKDTRLVSFAMERRNRVVSGLCVVVADVSRLVPEGMVYSTCPRGQGLGL